MDGLCRELRSRLETPGGDRKTGAEKRFRAGVWFSQHTPELARSSQTWSHLILGVKPRPLPHLVWPVLCIHPILSHITPQYSVRCQSPPCTGELPSSRSTPVSASNPGPVRQTTPQFQVLLSVMVLPSSPKCSACRRRPHASKLRPRPPRPRPPGPRSRPRPLPAASPRAGLTASQWSYS